ncbi:MAG: tRNA (uridine(34)/cytosine(34)/5-carboxymethylaminomethyluridine(34)-2'-O)-methyltransferase TrmL [Gammaproteobacteria bacterium]
MFHVVLYQPEIPPNTGNIIRLCANTGSQLHLIHPLGFVLDEKRLRRAGLDYHDRAFVSEHSSLQGCLEALETDRVFALTTKAETVYTDARFQTGDALLFGPETRGLPNAVLATLAAERKLRIPMRTTERSLNLSNTVALVVYEALRQNGFAGLE